MEPEQKIPINSLFYSVQGEGSFSGAPSLFIRTSGCNSAYCGHFCDTQHAEHKMMSVGEIMIEAYKILKPYTCASYVNVVLTGGEPTMHELTALIHEIKNVQLFSLICLETNGTLKPAWLDLLDFITVSPKAPIDELQMIEADEVKIVVTDKLANEQVDAYINFYSPVRPQYYLQPVSNNPIIAKRCLEYVKRHPWCGISCQMQKVFGFG